MIKGTSLVTNCRVNIPHQTLTLSRRSYSSVSSAGSWEELWEAGNYYDRVSELIEDAQHYAIFVGWQIDSRLPFRHPQRPETVSSSNSWQPSVESLKEKVVRICREKPDFHVYFLMWDHAYFYVFERELLQGQVWENIHPNVHFIFDNRHPFGGSHHEKLVVMDGKVALAGGIDLCDERWDSPQHFFEDPRRSLNLKHEHHGPYHDVGVQVSGPVCTEIHRHIEHRWRTLSSLSFPPPSQETTETIHESHRVYVSRTLSSVDAEETPHTIVRECEFLFLELIAIAKKRLILEGQYFWSERICDALIAKIEEMRGTDFQIYLILAHIADFTALGKQMGYWELRLLEKLEDAATFAGVQLVMGRPYVYASPDDFGHELGDDIGRVKPKSIYVHSKVVITDDSHLSIGSANFAARAFRVDTELNLTLEAGNENEREHIRAVAEQILNHWGLGKRTPENPCIRLRIFHPHQELRELRAAHPILSRIPWQIFFDPVMPWAFAIKKRVRLAVRRKKFGILLGGLFLIWLTGLACCVLLSNPESPEQLSFLALLYSAWLIPVPFVLTAVAATLRLGTDLGPMLAVHAFWVASIWGYFFARVFPSAIRRIFTHTAPPRLPALLAQRSFAHLLKVLFDPRIGVRNKIAFEGLFYVPLPWLLVGNLLLVPSVIYVTLHYGGKIIDSTKSNPYGLLMIWVAVVSMSASVLQGLKTLVSRKRIEKMIENPETQRAHHGKKAA